MIVPAKIHLRTYEGLPNHPRMRPACGPAWVDYDGNPTFDASDDPWEVTCKSCQRTKDWGDRVTANRAEDRPDVVGHLDADGIVTLEWKDDQIRETLVSRELLEQMVAERNQLQRLRNLLAEDVTNVTQGLTRS